MKKFLKENLYYVLVILLALTIKTTHVFGINLVDGHSMDNTLHNNQIVLGSSIMSLERGDIVVAKNGNKLVVKRIIGMPGETVSYIDGVLYVNGLRIKEDYLTEKNCKNSFNDTWEFVCGEDEFLILGDNRDNSYDGRYYGPISREQIIEKIYIRF